MGRVVGGVGLAALLSRFRRVLYVYVRVQEWDEGGEASRGSHRHRWQQPSNLPLPIARAVVTATRGGWAACLASPCITPPPLLHYVLPCITGVPRAYIVHAPHLPLPFTAAVITRCIDLYHPGAKRLVVAAHVTRSVVYCLRRCYQVQRLTICE